MTRFWSPVLFSLVVFGTPARAVDSETSLTDDEVVVTREVQLAIERGHDWLVSRQGTTGAFDDVASEYTVAVTAFACLSLMAGGHVPGRGEYGESVERGILYLIDRCRKEDGYFWRHGDSSRMHGHGFATLAIAQAYGMTDVHREKIRRALVGAVRLSESAQTVEGGWGYEPGDSLHEGSVTVGQLQALRAARDVGIVVDIGTIEKAREYLRLSANDDGSFKYRLDHAGGRSSFPLTAAGVASLQARGDYAAEEIERGLDFMMEYIPPRGSSDRYYTTFYYYGQFYAAQAMYHASDRNYWRRWYPAMTQELMEEYYKPVQEWNSRDKGGYWHKSRFGDVYATAVATLILQIPYKYLPIFQR